MLLPAVHAGIQAVSCAVKRPRPWFRRTYAWAGTDVLALAGLVVASEVGAFAEAVFAAGCGFKCLEVTAKPEPAGLLLLCLASLMGWAGHATALRWWITPVAAVAAAARRAELDEGTAGELLLRGSDESDGPGDGDSDDDQHDSRWEPKSETAL